MEIVTIDEGRLESIALLLSSLPNLPHRHYQNRAMRFCYLIPVQRPDRIYISAAHTTDTSNDADLHPVPITGDIRIVEGEEVVVCCFVAYAVYHGKSLLSTHCEKIIQPSHYITSPLNVTVGKLNGSVLTAGLPLSVTKNVVDLKHYRKRIK